MRIPTIRGIIDRRILVNFHIDPKIMASVLPAPFRPKIVNGYAIGGVCLIRLTGMRPKFSPLPCGMKSENAAHRIAVEWDENGEIREGVYIPRRDTDSRFNTLVGGTIFLGVHYHARFTVDECKNHYSIKVQSDDGIASIHVKGKQTKRLPPSSVFSSLAEASEFFRLSSLGYSDSKKAGRYEGLEMQCNNWHADALEIETIESSYFDDESIFPTGSVEFDSALLMKGIDHQWNSKKSLCGSTL